MIFLPVVVLLILFNLVFRLIIGWLANGEREDGI
jgi:hypothetical protein